MLPDGSFIIGESQVWAITDGSLKFWQVTPTPGVDEATDQGTTEQLSSRRSIYN